MTTRPRRKRGEFRDDYELWLCKIARELDAKDRWALWRVAEGLWRAAHPEREQAKGAA